MFVTAPSWFRARAQVCVDGIEPSEVELVAREDVVMANAWVPVELRWRELENEESEGWS